MNKGNYQLLIEKLDQFIRKYYVNQLVRGVLYSTALLLVLFLTFNLVERYFYLNTDISTSSLVRKVLYYSFIATSAFSLITWIVIPLSKYFRLGSVISHNQAASIIGQHFTDVKDKLINILQLREQANQLGQQELLLASIDQKSEEIKLVPFKNAIDLNQNRKYLRYVVPPMLVLIAILFAAPSLIKDSTSRLINNKGTYQRPAPFYFIVDKESLEVVQFEDFELIVNVDGTILPNEVFINVDNYEYRMTKKDAKTFAYQFKNVQDKKSFRLYSGNINSEKYALNVLKKPNMLDFQVKLEYPIYTGIKNEIVNNIGDLNVPEGTKVSWTFSTRNTDAIEMRFSDSNEKIVTKRLSNTGFSYAKKATQGELYKVFLSNKSLPNADSVAYSIAVIQDKYPTIEVEQFVDSSAQKLLYFVGNAADDYGLLSLSFNYQIKSEKGKATELQTIKLKKPAGKQVDYDYQFDMTLLELKPGDQVTYYFEVFDNDGVNGSKSSRTNMMVFALPTVEQYEAMAEKNSDQIKSDLQKAMKESKKLQEEMRAMREKLLQKKEIDWQDRKAIEKMLERQKELEKQIKEAQQAFEENLKNQEEYKQTPEETQQKEEQIQKMFEQTLNDEMQELMQQIQQLLEELEKDKAIEIVEQMQMNDEQLEKNLDRLLELYKQLELEKEMTDLMNKLEQLAEEQEKLSKETEQQAKDQNKQNEQQQQQKQEELQQKQEALNKAFEKAQEKMDNIEKKNEELERKQDLGDMEEDMKDIEQDMEDSKEQLQEQQNQKAAKSQKSAAQKMRKAAQKMAQKMEENEMEQLQEDMDDLRQLLENLVQLSFEQEDVMKRLTPIDVTTPKYVELVQKQFKLKDDFRLIEDSLTALSKRIIQIESFVNDKVAEVKRSMKTAMEDLEERRKPRAAEYQQRAMKNVNDLALILSETLEQLQQQMSNSMPGSQMCNNPGSKGKSGNTPQDKLSEGQQQLNEQMRGMKEKMDGGGKVGSKEFAQMAARQAALRQALKEKQRKLSESGKGSKELEDAIQQMDKIETELVNKKLTNEMQKRQAEILTRLLEHEKAEREKEYENQRKAERPSDIARQVPPSLEEYLKKREQEIKPYQTISPNLKPYYKSLVEKYVQTLKEGK